MNYNFAEMNLEDYVEEHEVAPFEAYVNHWYCGGDLPDLKGVLEEFRDAYEGEWDSELDFVYHLVDDMGLLNNVPEEVANYFDYDSYKRDLFIDDYWSAESGNYTKYIFRFC